jgi:recombinational DNA repair ATPase RecF
MIEKLKNVSPIILLDDVYGELDNERQQMLLVLFRNKQLVITSTHPLQTVPAQTTQIEIALSQTDSIDGDQN